MEGVKGALTRKLGPLPAWGWAVAVGGSVILFRIVTGKGAFPASPPATSSGSSGGSVQPVIPGNETSALSQLSASDLAALKAALASAPVAGGGNAPPATNDPFTPYEYAKSLFASGQIAHNPGTLAQFQTAQQLSGHSSLGYVVGQQYSQFLAKGGSGSFSQWYAKAYGPQPSGQPYAWWTTIQSAPVH